MLQIYLLSAEPVIGIQLSRSAAELSIPPAVAGFALSPQKNQGASCMQWGRASRGTTLASYSVSP